MTPERWQQINDLYLASLEQEPSERAAYIAEACKADEELRREVESLIASHDEDDSFIEQPVFSAVARLLTADRVGAMTGLHMGHYELLNQIGKGGMGEVYLAQDTRLGRQVAIKLLPDRFTLETDRVRRFQQEARAASALNQPNILTIHEVGDVENRPYIATEFIDGQTLRQIMTGGGMKLHEALDVAIQVTSALSAAHEAGIVHRDIKPENIMVRRRDHLVKVLDFGLAKLTDEAPRKPQTNSDTPTLLETDPNTVMGTVSYMSPEQARALPVDARTDIFSLGVVLYEMMAGRRPFEGSTQSGLIVSILEKKPLPLSSHRPDAPRDMESIVTKALEKDAGTRYQTIQEMGSDLRRLRRQLKTQAEVGLSGEFEWGDEASVNADGEPRGINSAQGAATLSNKTRTLPTFSVQYLVSEIKEHKAGVLMAVAPLFLIIFAAFYFLRSSSAGKPFESLAIMPFSFSSTDPNVMADPDREYLSDGISERLINYLSQLPLMKVIASASVFHYKGKEIDPQKVG
ncbi:MAG: eukaryotic-like serine/threonine-protein kinase, partial [Acidobacteriota bacterium]|nr:eukaryotic-like serine/threonine-protein kinase [Acidobacteriota bacterium]